MINTRPVQIKLAEVKDRLSNAYKLYKKDWKMSN
jgi:hypothetical protein